MIHEIKPRIYFGKRFYISITSSVEGLSKALYKCTITQPNKIISTFHLRQLHEYFKITESIYIQDLLKSAKLAWSLKFNSICVRSVARAGLRLGKDKV